MGSESMRHLVHLRACGVHLRAHADGQTKNEALLLVFQNSIPRISSRACAQCDSTGVRTIMGESKLVSLIPEHDAAVLERRAGEPIHLAGTLDRQSGKAQV